MAYRHLPSPDFHRLDCQHYGLREDEHDDEDDSLISGSGLKPTGIFSSSGGAGGRVTQCVPRTEWSRILLDLTNPRACDLVLLFEVRHHGLEFDVRHERGHGGIITHQRQDSEDTGKDDA